MDMIDRIKARMDALGLIPQDLVGRLGVSKGTVSNMLNRNHSRGIDEKTVEKLARILKSTPAYLRYGIEDSVQQGPDIKGFVPVISWIAAGQWREMEEHYVTEDTEFVACPHSHGQRTYALRVVGDSMTAPHGRSFPEGYLIFVDPDLEALPGDFVIAKLKTPRSGSISGVTFKQLAVDGDTPYLRPLNSMHPPIFDEFDVIGRVIGSYLPL
jgi:SOS-response transcriptional repressor LexA